jgi:phage gpG-like protein
MKIKIDITRAKKKLARIKDKVKTLPWDVVGDIVLQEIDASFDKGGSYKKQGSFEGGSRKWVKRKKPAKHPILQKSQKMRRRIGKIVKSNEVTVKSAMAYSATQQYGDKSRNISARPFVIFHKIAKKKIIKKFIAHLSSV